MTRNEAKRLKDDLATSIPELIEKTIMKRDRVNIEKGKQKHNGSKSPGNRDRSNE